MPEETIQKLPSSWDATINNYYKAQYTDAENIIFLDSEFRVPTYSGFTIETDTSRSKLLIINNADVTDLSTFRKMAYSQIPDKTEIYHIYQGNNEESFLMYCIPWEE